MWKLPFSLPYRQEFQQHTCGSSLRPGFYELFALYSNLRPTGSRMWLAIRNFNTTSHSAKRPTSAFHSNTALVNANDYSGRPPSCDAQWRLHPRSEHAAEKWQSLSDGIQLVAGALRVTVARSFSTGKKKKCPRVFFYSAIFGYMFKFISLFRIPRLYTCAIKYAFSFFFRGRSVLRVSFDLIGCV